MLSLPKLIHVSTWGKIKEKKAVLTHLGPASYFSLLLWISKFKCYNWSWVKNRICHMRNWHFGIFYVESEPKKIRISHEVTIKKKIQFWIHPYWYINVLRMSEQCNKLNPAKVYQHFMWRIQTNTETRILPHQSKAKLLLIWNYLCDWHLSGRHSEFDETAFSGRKLFHQKFWLALLQYKHVYFTHA